MLGFVQSVADDFAADARRVAAAARRNTILGVMAGLFGLTAYGAGVAALAFFMAETMGMAQALLIVCLAALGLAFALYVTIRIFMAMDARIAARREARTRMVTSLVGSVVPALVTSSSFRKTAMIGAGAWLFSQFFRHRSRPAAGAGDYPHGVTRATRDFNGFDHHYRPTHHQEEVLR